ncbi:DapH/DapD/GlmU-related protein [Lolliginicoccus lacisalsi]|nr:DapH/DapD/GlmU-related protein [Lolliginicoccus lacisalsi]
MSTPGSRPAVTPMTVERFEAILKRQSRLPAALQQRMRAMIRRSAISGKVTHGHQFWPSRGCTIFATHSLEIGHFVKIGPDTRIEVNGTIGSFSGISHHSVVVGRRDHSLDAVGMPVPATPWIGDRDLTPDDILTIGIDVYVGAGSTVLSGVTIGDGAVVAAGSVVIKDVPPFAVVAGSPAREVGRRFPTEQDERDHLEALHILIDEIEQLRAAGKI